MPSLESQRICALIGESDLDADSKDQLCDQITQIVDKEQPFASFDSYEEMAHDVCSMTVRQYFAKYLGADLLGEDREIGPNPNGLDMPIATPCGFACKQAIDAAALFQPFCSNAGDSCIGLARDAVKVLIFG